MDVLQKVVYDEQKVPIARIPTKASVKLISSSSSTIQHNDNNSTSTSTEYYESRYVPEAWAPDSRGTYGGDLISQGLNAAWQSVLNRSKDANTATTTAAAAPDDGLNFQPHSLHTYFVKAGSSESVMRWEVIKVSDSRNFANRCVLGYQSHSDVLVVTLQVSFTRDNDIVAKQRQFEQQMAQVAQGEEGKGQEKQVKHWPLVFKRNPGPMFYKYRDNLQDLDVRTLYYSNHITRAMPKEFFKPSEDFNLNTTADQELGMFIKVNDDLNGVVVDGSEKEKEQQQQGLPSAIELVRRKYLALAYASDAFWASTLMKALGLPLGITNFKTVSLDHTLYFHDSNFEIGKSTNNNKQKKTETDSKREKSNGAGTASAPAIDLDNDNWIYMETQFVSLGNNRLVAIINFYSLENDGTLIATAVQENYGVLPKQVVENSNELHEKYNNNGKSTATIGGAKL